MSNIYNLFLETYIYPFFDIKIYPFEFMDNMYETDES